MAPEEQIKVEPGPIGAEAPLVTQRVSEFEVSRRRVRIFLANRLIALGWALKGSCKPCAHWLFTTGRWLVPEAQRFLVHRTGSPNSHRRIFEFAVDLGTLLSRIYPGRVVVGFLIVVVFLVSLDLAMRTTATGTQPLVEDSTFQRESRTPSKKSKVLSVSKSSEPVQLLETGSLSRAQIAVPLPLRKPERVYKVPNGKRAKANPASQKRMAQQKRAKPKPMR